MSKLYITHSKLYQLAKELANVMSTKFDPFQTILLYPIPRGGVPVAYILTSFNRNFSITDDPSLADYFIDDLIDSGATCEKWCETYPGTPFLALFDKRDEHCPYKNQWVVFPWEGSAEAGITDHIKRLLEYIGEDPARGGLLETPDRVAKAWGEWTSGYDKEPDDVLKTFKDGAEGCDTMVVVKDIPFYTHCEHHMAPFFGTATVAYIPNKKIVGLSKLSRIVDIYARRLQVQERMTNQIADAIHKHLEPIGVGVTLKARHLCMESRGVCQQGHSTITTALRGVIREDSAARTEFLDFVK